MVAAGLAALVTWRERRRESADRRVQRAREQLSPAAEVDRLAARRNRIALARPTRPTWIGDRVAAADSRVYHQYRPICSPDGPGSG